MSDYFEDLPIKDVETEEEQEEKVDQPLQPQVSLKHSNQQECEFNLKNLIIQLVLLGNILAEKLANIPSPFYKDPKPFDNDTKTRSRDSCAASRKQQQCETRVTSTAEQHVSPQNIKQTAATFCVVVNLLMHLKGCMVLADMKQCNPQPPDCMPCEGTQYYHDRLNNTCQMCLFCPPGFEPNRPCPSGGFDDGGQQLCLPCGDNFFSKENDQKQCSSCQICDKTVNDQPCNATSDRECGTCQHGFGLLDMAHKERCLPCSLISQVSPQSAAKQASCKPTTTATSSTPLTTPSTMASTNMSNPESHTKAGKGEPISSTADGDTTTSILSTTSTVTSEPHADMEDGETTQPSHAIKRNSTSTIAKLVHELTTVTQKLVENTTLTPVPDEQHSAGNQSLADVDMQPSVITELSSGNGLPVTTSKTPDKSIEDEITTQSGQLREENLSADVEDSKEGVKDNMALDESNEKIRERTKPGGDEDNTPAKTDHEGPNRPIHRRVNHPIAEKNVPIIAALLVLVVLIIVLGCFCNSYDRRRRVNGYQPPETSGRIQSDGDSGSSTNRIIGYSGQNSEVQFIGVGSNSTIHSRPTSAPTSASSHNVNSHCRSQRSADTQNDLTQPFLSTEIETVRSASGRTVGPSICRSSKPATNATKQEKMKSQGSSARLLESFDSPTTSQKNFQCPASASPNPLTTTGGTFRNNPAQSAVDIDEANVRLNPLFGDQTDRIEPGDKYNSLNSLDRAPEVTKTDAAVSLSFEFHDSSFEKAMSPNSNDDTGIHGTEIPARRNASMSASVRDRSSVGLPVQETRNNAALQPGAMYLQQGTAGVATRSVNDASINANRRPNIATADVGVSGSSASEHWSNQGTSMRPIVTHPASQMSYPQPQQQLQPQQQFPVNQQQPASAQHNVPVINTQGLHPGQVLQPALAVLNHSIAAQNQAYDATVLDQHPTGSGLSPQVSSSQLGPTTYSPLLNNPGDNANNTPTGRPMKVNLPPLATNLAREAANIYNPTSSTSAMPMSGSGWNFGNSVPPSPSGMTQGPFEMPQFAGTPPASHNHPWSFNQTSTSNTARIGQAPHRVPPSSPTYADSSTSPIPMPQSPRAPPAAGPVFNSCQGITFVVASNATNSSFVVGDNIKNGW